MTAARSTAMFGLARAIGSSVSMASSVRPCCTRRLEICAPKVAAAAWCAGSRSELERRGDLRFAFRNSALEQCERTLLDEHQVLHERQAGRLPDRARRGEVLAGARAVAGLEAELVQLYVDVESLDRVAIALREPEREVELGASPVETVGKRDRGRGVPQHVDQRAGVAPLAEAACDRNRLVGVLHSSRPVGGIELLRQHRQESRPVGTVGGADRTRARAR